MTDPPICSSTYVRLLRILFEYQERDVMKNDIFMK